MAIELSDAQIGANVTQMRENAGLSMEATAAAMRNARYAWTRNTIFSIEHGSRKLRLDEAVALVQLYGFEVEDGLKRLVEQSPAGKATAEITQMSRSAVIDFLEAYAKILVARMRAKWALNDNAGAPYEDILGHTWVLGENEREQVATELARMDCKNLRSMLEEVGALDNDELESIDDGDLYEIRYIGLGLPVALRNDSTATKSES